MKESEKKRIDKMFVSSFLIINWSIIVENVFSLLVWWESHFQEIFYQIDLNCFAAHMYTHIFTFTHTSKRFTFTIHRSKPHFMCDRHCEFYFWPQIEFLFFCISFHKLNVQQITCAITSWNVFTLVFYSTEFATVAIAIWHLCHFKIDIMPFQWVSDCTLSLFACNM